jgi:hypothetical protein
MGVTRNLCRRLWCAQLCPPRLALRPPAGPRWIQEVKQDGFRILATQNPDGVHLFTREGYDLAVRFTLSRYAWPPGARAQQAALPVIGYLSPLDPEPTSYLVAAFRKGLSEAGYVEGQNVPSNTAGDATKATASRNWRPISSAATADKGALGIAVGSLVT